MIAFTLEMILVGLCAAFVLAGAIAFIPPLALAAFFAGRIYQEVR